MKKKMQNKKKKEKKEETTKQDERRKKTQERKKKEGIGKTKDNNETRRVTDAIYEKGRNPKLRCAATKVVAKSAEPLSPIDS